MKPIPLLVNAAARISKKGAFHAWLDNNHKAFRIIRPGSPEEMSDYCSRLAREGTPLVAVAGETAHSPAQHRDWPARQRNSPSCPPAP